MSDIDAWEEHAARLRNHIQKIRIDYPEAADARRQELREVYLRIAEMKRSPAPSREDIDHGRED